MSFFAPFISRARAGDAWFSVGLVSSFPDVTTRDLASLAEPRRCDWVVTPGCKVFHVPRQDSSKATEVALNELEPPETGGLKDQVMVFRYNGKFHAVNHECPHSSYPLSNGTPFDIEDFGIVLSSGITCPKHNWSFDLFTGKSDHGSYKLQIWELELRPVSGSKAEAADGDTVDGHAVKSDTVDGDVVKEDIVDQDTQDSDDEGPTEMEVWVRRKQRMG